MKNTKQYLNNEDILINTFNNNKTFNYEIYSAAYEYNMELQYFECKDAKIEGLNYNDHYNSFFYTIYDRNAFLSSAINNDYLISTKNMELHKKLDKAFNTFLSMNYDNKQYDNLDQWLDEKAEELKDEWETYLHTYEDIDYNECIDYLINNIDNYESYYILNNDYKHIYRDIPAHTEECFLSRY